MKTGFIQGFVNLMKPKTYPYHGILNRCGVQPEIPPYIGPDMKPVGQEWVLAWEGSLYTPPGGIITKYPDGFLQSSDDHPCPEQTCFTKNVYYFCEVYLWQREYNSVMTMAWGDGINCMRSWKQGNWLYWYKAWFNYCWGGTPEIFWVYKTGYSSTGRLWKSLTGEFPGYYPMPQREIIRV